MSDRPAFREKGLLSRRGPGPRFSFLLPFLFLFWTAPAAPAQQILQNGSLDKAQPFPWNHPLYGKSVVTLEVDPKGGVGGSPCLSIEGKAPRGEREWFQLVREGFPKGSEVTLSAMVRTEKVTGGAWLAIRAKKGIRYLAWADTRSQGLISGDTPWKRLVLTFHVPRETDTLQVACVLQGKGKAFFDNIVLVPGSSPGSSGKSGGGGPTPAGPALSAAKEGGKGKNGVYLVRCSLEMRALHEEKHGRLYVALPALRKNQFPFYFKAESLPADGIQTIKALRKGGRNSPYLLELKIYPLKPGEKVKIDMETKVLVLAREKEGPPLPKDLGERPKFPREAKPYLKPTRLLRSFADQAAALEKVLPPKPDLPRLLAVLTGAARKVSAPALALAAALRNQGLPARLVSGVCPSPAPTQPEMGVEVWLPGPGWILLLPGPGLVRPPAWRFLVFREIPRDGETKVSRLFPSFPYLGFLEAKGNFRVRGLKDPAKGAYLECLESLSLTPPPADLRATLEKDLAANWRRWLKARKKGTEDAEAEFAGETASQTKDYKEMIRILEGK